MPSSVRSVMAAAGLEPEGVVGWGKLINTDEPGIYVVSDTEDTDVQGVDPRRAPIDIEAVETLMELRPELTVDGQRPTVEQLASRLREFWLPDEHILYIGLAADLHDRVNQYYGTPLGARRPHAGGWFLKTLASLDRMVVHWTRTYDRVTAEHAAIGAFVGAVSPESIHRVRDADHPFPFANLEWPAGTRKKHGISGAKAPRVRLPGTESAGRAVRAKATIKKDTASKVTTTAPSRATGKSAPTQRVTGPDIAGGRIRIPRGSKHLFPSEKGHLEVFLRGSAVQAPWDPRLGPPEKSGVLRVGRALLGEKVGTDEVLMVSVAGSRYELK